MNLYVIELKDRIKVGVSKNDIKERVSAILSAGGHGKNDIVKVYNFPNQGFIESPLKRLFKRFLIEKSEISRGSEWFYKKEIVEHFIKRINNKEIPSKELIDKLQYDNSNSGSFYKKNAFKLYIKIKNERKGSGFPNSVSFDEFMKSGEMHYKNMHYKVNDDYTNFIREPKFELDFISNSQMVECLRIIKNNTNNKIKQTKIQSCIDDVFNGVDESLSTRLKLISNYFFDGELLITCENKNIRINFCKDYNYYSFDNNYEDLNFEEQILIKKSRVTYVSPNKIIIQHKDKNCICRFNYSSIERIQNLLKKRDYCDYLEIEEMLEEFKINYPNANPIPEPIEKSINELEDVELFHFLNSKNVSIKEYKIQFNFGEYDIEWKYKDSLEEVKKFLQGLDIVITKNHEIFESSKQIVIEKEKSDHELINRIVKEHFENKIALKNSINPNIRIKKEKDYNFYYLTNKFERLKDEELTLIKVSKNIQLHDNFLNFSYMDGICVCDFNRSKLVIIKIFLNDVNYVDFTSEIIETIEIKQNEPLNIRPMRRISVNK